MSPNRDIRDISSRLLPHQTAFVDAFFAPRSRRVILLRAEPGLGKSTALVVLSTRLLQGQPTARVLILLPAAILRDQFAERLREAGIRVLTVDRYQFREMLDSSIGGQLWPTGFVTILSRETARQKDIQDALATTRWDLMIVDEVHSFRGPNGEGLLRSVGDTSDRIVISALPDQELPNLFSEASIDTIDWRSDLLVGPDGKPLNAMPQPLLHEVPFSSSAAERIVAAGVQTLASIIEAGTQRKSWFAKSLVRSFQSSPVALENKLQLVAATRNQMAIDTELKRDLTEDDLPEDEFEDTTDFAIPEKAKSIAADLLKEIEVAGSDSKLTAFDGLLTHLAVRALPPVRICVIAEYLATLFYLAAEVEARGHTSRALRVGMASEERQHTLDIFSRDGGLLIATTAAISQGFELGEVTDLVLYDAPHSPLALEQLLGRFNRFSNRTRLNVHVLVPSVDGDVISSGPSWQIRQLLEARKA